MAQLAAAQRKALAQTFNGFGTKIYGKRHFKADGSYLTTKWVVFRWIPVIPLKSLYVRYVGPEIGLFCRGGRENTLSFPNLNRTLGKL